MSLPAIASALPKPPSAPPIRAADLVSRVALKCLKELGAALLLGAAVACFVPSPAGISFMISALFVQMSVSLFFHSLGAFASYQISKQTKPSGPYLRVLSLCEWATGTNFAIFSGLNTQTLVHEAGHALAATAVYKNPRPQIILQPFFGGLTQFYKTGYTSFGKKIGSVAATCLVVASGPALTLLVSSALLLIGLSMKEKYPQFGKYLICWSLLDFYNHAHYAYSATWANPSDLTHDFVHLSVFGLKPMTATIGIAAIPLMMMAGSYWKKSGQPEELQLAPV